MSAVQNRPLYEVAADIEKAWPKVNYAARPYLDAMACLEGIDGLYGLDSGKSIVRYFLANASSFRGEDAKRLKAELKAML